MLYDCCMGALLDIRSLHIRFGAVAAVPTLRTGRSRPLAVVGGPPDTTGLYSPHTE
jgi:hypothetical protein